MTSDNIIQFPARATKDRRELDAAILASIDQYSLNARAQSLVVKRANALFEILDTSFDIDLATPVIGSLPLPVQAAVKDELRGKISEVVLRFKEIGERACVHCMNMDAILFKSLGMVAG